MKIILFIYLCFVRYVFRFIYFMLYDYKNIVSQTNILQEQLTVNQLDAGTSPAQGAIKFKLSYFRNIIS